MHYKFFFLLCSSKNYREKEGRTKEGHKEKDEGSLGGRGMIVNERERERKENPKINQKYQ